MTEDNNDWTIVTDPVPQRITPKIESELESQYLGLLLRNDECVERWTNENSPTLVRFEHGAFGRLARAIRDVWTRDRVRLTQKTYASMIEAAGVSKLDQISEEVRYNKVMMSGGHKPADLPMLRDRINATSGTPEGRNASVVNLAKAIQSAALKSVQRLQSYQHKPEDTENFDHLLDAVKSLRELANGPPKLHIRSSSDPAADHVKPAAVIEGVIRRGQIANFVSSPKMRKSWTMHDLAFSVASGTPWLGRFECQPSKVLLIDNELRTWELTERLATICRAKGITDPVPFDYVALRDSGMVDINQLSDIIPDGYDLIILDALYRFYPRGFNENDNAAMTSLYNTLDRVATRTGAAIIIVHHASKGDQSGKATTDMGLGAGAQSRAADAHISLRAVPDKSAAPTDDPTRAELTARVRSFVPVPPLHLEWAFPFWKPTDSPESEQKRTGMTCAEFGDKFARDSWESRTDIETRARDEKMPIRGSRELFDGALATGVLVEKKDTDGKKRTKLYKLANPVSTL